MQWDASNIKLKSSIDFNEMKRASILFLIALLAFFFLRFLNPIFSESSGHPSSPRPEGGISKQGQNVSAIAITPVVPTPTTDKGVTNRLIDEFNDSADGRATVLNLWNKEGQGGRYYASSIADFCSGVSKVVPDALTGQASLKDVSPDRQLTVIAAYEFIQRRCGQFTNEEFGKYSRHKLLRDGYSADPLVQVVKDFNSTSYKLSRDNFVKALGNVLDTQDPMLFEDIGIKLSLHPGENGAYLHFDGKDYPMKDSPAIAAAYQLVPCGLGLKCNSSDPMLALACASGAMCYKDRYQKIYEEIALGNDATYAEILKFQAKLISAIKNREIQKFLPNE